MKQQPNSRSRHSRANGNPEGKRKSPRKNRFPAHQGNGGGKHSLRQRMVQGFLSMNWNQAEKWLIGSLGFGAIALSLEVMLTRYIFPAWHADWADEIIIILVLWAIWLSGGRLVSERAHVTTDVIVNLVSAKTLRLLAIPHYLLGAAFCGVYAWAGIEVVAFAIVIGEKSEASLQYPLWIYYLCIPVGAALMGLRYLQLLREEWREDSHDDSE